MAGLFILRVFARNLHTYIHNWPLQPFSQDYQLVSHTTDVVCVNFIHMWRDLQFKVDSKRQILRKLFHGRLIYTQSLCQKSAERKSPRKYFCFFFIFENLCWFNRHKTRVCIPGQTSNQKYRNISLATSSHQSFVKNPESKNKIAMKSFSKICRSESTLNCRSRQFTYKEVRS